MKITNVAGCPYEDHEGEILNIDINLEEGEKYKMGKYCDCPMIQ